jgi:hypothetical protein
MCKQGSQFPFHASVHIMVVDDDDASAQCCIRYACLALGAVGNIKAAQQVVHMRVVGLLAAFIICGCLYQVPFPWNIASVFFRISNLIPGFMVNIGGW